MLALAAVVALGGCGETPIFYFAGADHELITPASVGQDVPVSTPVRVEVTFLRNGQHIPDADHILRREVINALNKTTVLQAVEDPSVTAVLNVTVDDIIDDSAASPIPYFTSGLTHGAVSSSRVTDRYEFKLHYLAESGQERFARDRHSIWTSVGDKAPPPSLRGPYATPQRAFQVVVEDVMLSFLKNIAASNDTPDSLMFTPQEAQ